LIQSANPSVVRRTDGKHRELRYDTLLIGTGARPVRPGIEGIDLPGVFPLHTMEDSFATRSFLELKQPKSAIIVGAGYIGLEMADPLTHRGIQVTVASRTKAVLATVDSQYGKLIEAELEKHGVKVWNGVDVNLIRSVGDQLLVSGNQGFSEAGDLVLVGVGVRPNSELGARVGVMTGTKGALCVDRHMATNLSDVYTAGDCVETWHRLLGRYTYLPLGTTAHKQGRIAAENVVGRNRACLNQQGCVEITIRLG
jgi:pyruvate/2-oxoglutarate dehydrogenase complex dihydrolipoamide dehydrogenase (E3) component